MSEITLLNYNEIEKGKEPVVATSYDIKILDNAFEGAKGVDAREVWKGLESKQQFSDWIKSRISKLNLIENTDFIILRNQANKGFGGDVKSKTYIISLDIAKHFCMLENTQKGHLIRKYFIECEKELRQKSFKPITLKESLQLSLKLLEENERLLIENADQKEIINSYKIADRTKRNKQELATLLNRKIRELADKQYNKQYHKAYLAVYEEFAKLHCFTHKVDMQFLRTNIDYLSECLKMVLDFLDKE